MHLQSSGIDPQWKKLLDTVGVSDEQLKDQDTANFIYDFIEKHGGIQEANRQLGEANRQLEGAKHAAPPPLPNRGHPIRSGHSHSPSPPPPPPPRVESRRLFTPPVGK